MKQGDKNSLPKGWEIKKLGEVCETRAGGTPLKSHKEYYEGGNIPWLLSGEVSQGEIFEVKNFITEKGLNNSSAKIFPLNTVLVAMYGATAGQVGILRIEASTNQAVCGILPNNVTVPEYLFYCFLSKKEELISQAVGGAQPNISQIKIKNTLIPLPSIEEQQSIVAKLDEAFEAIEKAKANAEQNLKNAKELFDSYLQAIFENKGKDWEKKTLSEIADIKGGKRVPKGYCLETKSTGYPYIRVTDFNDEGGVDLKDIHYISKEVYEQIRNYTITTNDLYISIAGTIGKSGIIPNELNNANLTENACKLVFNIKLEPKFIYYFTKTEDFAKQASLNTRVAAMPKLALTRLSTITLNIPNSIYEQQSIVQKLDALSAETKKLEAIYLKKLEDLEELKKSILQKAFSGQL